MMFLDHATNLFLGIVYFQFQLCFICFTWCFTFTQPHHSQSICSTNFYPFIITLWSHSIRSSLGFSIYTEDTLTCWLQELGINHGPSRKWTTGGFPRATMCMLATKIATSFAWSFRQARFGWESLEGRNAYTSPSSVPLPGCDHNKERHYCHLLVAVVSRNTLHNVKIEAWIVNNTEERWGTPAVDVRDPGMVFVLFVLRLVGLELITVLSPLGSQVNNGSGVGGPLAPPHIPQESPQRETAQTSWKRPPWTAFNLKPSLISFYKTHCFACRSSGGNWTLLYI